MSPPKNRRVPPPRFPLLSIVGFLVYSLLPLGLLILLGRDIRWFMGWAYTGLSLASIVGSRIAVWKKSPDLILERAKAATVKGAEGWDRVMVILVAVAGPVAMLIVAGFDHRFGWGPPVSPITQVIGLGLHVAGLLLAVWSMMVNAFFSAVVRIQKERGHRVVSTGPYAIVRHPAYLGGIVSGLAAPFMLDALWALLPSVIFTVFLVVRTALEDSTLKKELRGYKNYVKRTRFRLLPPVW